MLEKRVITRDQHSVSRQEMSENALKVLYRLHKSGYQAYLVGGGVRDILLGKHPKDFDIATNATPEQIKGLFRNCRLVGRRFRLAHILFGRDVIEVATFRGHHDQAEEKLAKRSDAGLLLRDNVYGDIDEDAERRDFTVNALYYNIADFSVIDFAGGLEDIKAKRLRLIGDPETRYREDPVRMLRAIRFAAKLDFSLDAATAEPIHRLAPLLKDIPSARLFEESLKLLLSGQGEATFKQLRDSQLLYPLFPLLKPMLSQATEADLELRFMLTALRNTDQRIHDDLRVTPAFIFAALLWPLLEIKKNELLIELSLGEHDAALMAMNWLLEQQCKSIAIPKRFTAGIRDIWQLQSRLERRQGKRAFLCYGHPRFRAAFDFLELRAKTSQDPELLELAQWWQQWQKTNEQGRNQMVRDLSRGKPRQSRPRKRRAPAKPKS